MSLGTVGPYTQAELPSLMKSAHWMIVPSRWWENSPMVILEAAKHGLPVICSNIGGMQEKVADGVTGVHFKARRADSLADALAWGNRTTLISERSSQVTLSIIIEKKIRFRLTTDYIAAYFIVTAEKRKMLHVMRDILC